MGIQEPEILVGRTNLGLKKYKKNHRENSVERKETSENQTLEHPTFRSQGHEDTLSIEAEECQVRQEEQE